MSKYKEYREYQNEPKCSGWLFVLMVFIILLPGFVGGYESQINAIEVQK